MAPRAATMSLLFFFAMLAITVAACPSKPPPEGPPPPAAGAGGRGGGRAGAGGAGGAGGAVEPDAASPGTGGAPSGTPEAGAGGAGGNAPPPIDTAAADAPGPAAPANPERPLPPCAATTPVSSTAQLAAAIAAAQPGACIVLGDGSYTFPAITKTGTEAAPIVIRAANRGKAVMASGVLHLLESAHVVVEGLDITSAGAASTFTNGGSAGMLVAFTDSHNCRLARTRIHPAGAVVERDWIVLSGGKTHDNRIDHNDLGPVTALANILVIDGTGQEEPLVPGDVSTRNRVDHNYFHDVNNTGGNNWEAIRVGRSWQGPTKGENTIEHNLFERADGDPETISVKSSDNVIRHNTLRATAGEIALRHGNRNQVYGNYILAQGNGGSRGIRVYGADHRIFNNYVAGAFQTGIWLDDGSAIATDEPGKEHYQVYRAWVFNNTVIGQDIRVGGSKPNHPKDCRVANNIITGAGKLNRDGNAIVDEGNLVGGPNPLTMEDGVFRLLPNAAGAAAIGKAVNTTFYGITDDIQGQPRVSHDLGADEQSTAPVTIPGPLTPADVGPAAP